MVQQYSARRLGFSLRNHTSIQYDLGKRIPNTLRLAIPAYLIAYALAMVLGLIAGSRHGHWTDKIIDGFCSIGIATPTFWVAMLLMYLFSYRWKLLPLMGMHTIGKEGEFGMSLPAMVTGAVITETIFNWPGIGSYFVGAIQSMDYPIVMAILVIVGNLLADVLVCLLDPRISSIG